MFWDNVRRMLGLGSGRARDTESDVTSDEGQALARPTGGVPTAPDSAQDSTPDSHSTTGSTPSDTFVGRASGDDPGAAGETGAERRTNQHR